VEFKKNTPYSFLIPLFLFLLNILIKSLFLSNRDIALDEPFSIYYGQMSMAEIVEMLYNENNPPLHFFILHFVIKLFGMGPVAVRFPSLLFSAFTAVVIYKIGDKFFSRIAGIGAALIFTFSTMHIFFSHEARVYPLFVLLTAGSLYYFLKIASSPLNKKDYYWLFALNVLLIYSHYFGFFVLFIEVVSLVLLKEKKKLIRSFFLLMLFAGLCYIPMILIFIHRLGVSTGKGTWVVAPGVTELYGNLNRFLNNKYNTMVLLVLFTVACCLLIYENKLKHKIKGILSNVYFKIVLAWFVIPYLIMFTVSFKYPMFIDRYILFTSVPFFIVIVVLLSYLYEAKRFLIAVLTVFVCSQLITVQLNPDNNRRLKELVDVVAKLKKTETPVLLAPDYAYMSFSYHYNLEYFQQAPKTVELLNREKIFPIASMERANEIINNQKPPAIIYVQAGTEFMDPDNRILKAVEAKYKEHHVFHVFEIYDVHYFKN
jgi:uncharacterized membrane protein